MFWLEGCGTEKTSWTFHNEGSETQRVYTLGVSPRNDSVKKARKAAATALNR
jgi:phenylacetate 2-hydroxylase